MTTQDRTINNIMLEGFYRRQQMRRPAMLSLFQDGLRKGRGFFTRYRQVCNEKRSKQYYKAEEYQPFVEKSLKELEDLGIVNPSSRCTVCGDKFFDNLRVKKDKC